MASPDELPRVLCEFVNLVHVRGVPMQVRHISFGASLYAISKKDSVYSLKLLG